ncbi:MAG: copper amine oxidase N-terminal domain-containing protein, partial [Caldisericaceae bacterium]
KNGGITWAKTYGRKSDYYAYSIQKTLDSGYIVCGKTSSFGAGGDDIFVLKLNSNGNVLWAKTYGKVGDEASYSIEQTADSGYIIAGQTSSFGAGGWDILILKLDQNGNISWAKTYGGKSDDYASSIQKTLDSGYIVSGVTSSYGAGGLDYLVLKLDSNGSVSWAKTYGGDNIDWSYSLQRVVDGGYIVIGKSSFNCVCGKDILALKIDFNGNILWAKTFGSEYDESANSIQQIADSGYIIAGQTSSFGAGGDDVLILKLDSSGNISWAKTFGSEGNESLNSIQQTTDSGYIACGQTSSFGVGGWDILLLKLDQNGNISCSNSNYLKDVKSKLDAESVSPFTSNVNINAISQGVKVSSINITTSSTNLNSKIVCGSIIIVLKIGDLNFTVNGVKNTLDSPPVIKNGRTLLPIRAIIESLGGSVGWDATEKKVAVSLGSKTIELWIGKSTAKVNGVNKPIDKDNSKVVPEIINGRTMLPLRFVAESLGCDVQWDANTKTITIKYIN